jgi:hypothetical protein
MRRFIYLILIPAIAGITTAAFGISWLEPETFNLAAAINIPICVLSTLVYLLGQPTN